DLLWTVARPIGEHDDLVVGQVGDGVDWSGCESPPRPDRGTRVQGDDDEAVAKRQLDEAIDHAKTLVPRGRASTRTPPPTRIRIRGDTPGCFDRLRIALSRVEGRLPWLNDENGEQEVFRDRRDRQRN